MTVDELKDIARAVTNDISVDDNGSLKLNYEDESDFAGRVQILVEEVMSLENSYIPVS